MLLLSSKIFHLKHQIISLALNQNLLPFFVTETIQDYSENEGKPVYLLLLFTAYC